jgi:cytidylate kinase
MIIAIDGPAGSGKSSTAKAVARKLGFRHLDSGAFYRAITFAALERGIAEGVWEHLDPAALNGLGVHAQAGNSGFEFFMQDRNITAEIRSAAVNAHVSQMAAVPAVRAWLLDQLREAGHAGRLVADGRDIGTVVFPDADLKVFLVAQSETRAKRRLAETGNDAPSYVEVQNEVDRLGRRDRLDSQRAAAPLRQAEDAVVIDTTELSFDEQVERIVELAIERMQ